MHLHFMPTDEIFIELAEFEERKKNALPKMAERKPDQGFMQNRIKLLMQQ